MGIIEHINCVISELGQQYIHKFSSSERQKDNLKQLVLLGIKKLIDGNICRVFMKVPGQPDGHYFVKTESQAWKNAFRRRKSESDLHCIGLRNDKTNQRSVQGLFVKNP